MSSNETSCQRNGLNFSLIVILGLGIYFGWHVEGVLPRYFLLVSLAAIGLVIGLVLIMASRAAVKRLETPSPLPIWVHGLLQAGLGFVLAFYVFKLDWKAALIFPVGAITASMVWTAIRVGNRPALGSLVVAMLIASAFAISLRMGGIQGSFLFGLGLLTSGLLGSMLLINQEGERSLWARALIFGGFLVAGRAAIQYYLLSSNYANLGVVVTHPYSFVALFAGLFVPIIYSQLEDERSLPKPVAWIVLGILLPLALGIFFHARPMAAYLFGVVVAGFAVGVIRGGSLGVTVMGYLSLAAVCFGLPLYRMTTNLSRTVRLEILGGIFLVCVIGYLILSRREAPAGEPS